MLFRTVKSIIFKREKEKKVISNITTHNNNHNDSKINEEMCTCVCVCVCTTCVRRMNDEDENKW